MLISTFSIQAHIFQWLLEKNAEYLSETKHYYMEHCSIDIIWMVTLYAHNKPYHMNITGGMVNHMGFTDF